MCLHGAHRPVGETEVSGMVGPHPESTQEHRKGSHRLGKVHWKEDVAPGTNKKQQA